MDGGTVHFITMQLVDGETLGEVIPPHGLPTERFFELAVPLADAVLEPGEGWTFTHSIAVLDNGRWVYFGRHDRESDIYLMHRER